MNKFFKIYVLKWHSNFCAIFLYVPNFYQIYTNILDYLGNQFLTNSSIQIDLIAVLWFVMPFKNHKIMYKLKTGYQCDMKLRLENCFHHDPLFMFEWLNRLLNQMFSVLVLDRRSARRFGSEWQLRRRAEWNDRYVQRPSLRRRLRQGWGHVPRLRRQLPTARKSNNSYSVDTSTPSYRT